MVKRTMPEVGTVPTNSRSKRETVALPSYKRTLHYVALHHFFFRFSAIMNKVMVNPQASVSLYSLTSLTHQARALSPGVET